MITSGLNNGRLKYEVVNMPSLIKVQQEIECYFYFSAHNILSISDMLQIKVLS